MEPLNCHDHADAVVRNFGASSREERRVMMFYASRSYPERWRVLRPYVERALKEDPTLISAPESTDSERRTTLLQCAAFHNLTEAVLFYLSFDGADAKNDYDLLTYAAAGGRHNLFRAVLRHPKLRPRLTLRRLDLIAIADDNTEQLLGPVLANFHHRVVLSDDEVRKYKESCVGIPPENWSLLDRYVHDREGVHLRLLEAHKPGCDA